MHVTLLGFFLGHFFPGHARSSVGEPHINLRHTEREQEYADRDDGRFFRCKEKRSRKRAEQKINRIGAFVVAQSGDDNPQREENKMRLVYEVARDVNVTGRKRYEYGCRERADSSYVATQRESEPDGCDAEDDGHKANGNGVQSGSFAEKKAVEFRDDEREIVERRTMIVRRVVMIYALAVKRREEESVDAFVVVHWHKAEFVKSYEGRAHKDRKARNPPRERRDFRRISRGQVCVGLSLRCI